MQSRCRGSDTTSAAVRRWGECRGAALGECRVARGGGCTSEASKVELDLGQPPQLQLRKEPPRVSAEAEHTAVGGTPPLPQSRDPRRAEHGVRRKDAEALSGGC